MKTKYKQFYGYIKFRYNCKCGPARMDYHFVVEYDGHVERSITQVWEPVVEATVIDRINIKKLTKVECCLWGDTPEVMRPEDSRGKQVCDWMVKRMTRRVGIRDRLTAEINAAIKKGGFYLRP